MKISKERLKQLYRLGLTDEEIDCLKILFDDDIAFYVGKKC